MSAWPTLPAGMVCQKCGERPADGMFSEGIMAALHSSYQWWCELCMVKAQLENARGRAAAIPELEAELARLQEKG